MFISCMTSPSAITLVASASTFMMRMSCTSTIIWKAREYKKSPISTLAGLPNLALAVGRPRRKVDSSTTSSCSKVAVWINSTTAAMLNRDWPWKPKAPQHSSSRVGRRRLPPAAMMCCATSPTSATLDERRCLITASTSRNSCSTNARPWGELGVVCCICIRVSLFLDYRQRLWHSAA